MQFERRTEASVFVRSRASSDPTSRCGTLDLFISGRGFNRRDHRLPPLSPVRCRRGETFSANGHVASRRDPTASDQCRWARRLSAGHPGAQGQWRTAAAVPMSAHSLLKQRSGAGSPIREEAPGRQPVVPIHRGGLADHRGIQGNERNSQGANPVAGKG